KGTPPSRRGAFRPDFFRTQLGTAKFENRNAVSLDRLRVPPTRSPPSHGSNLNRPAIPVQVIRVSLPTGWAVLLSTDNDAMTAASASLRSARAVSGGGHWRLPRR